MLDTRHAMWPVRDGYSRGTMTDAADTILGAGDPEPTGAASLRLAVLGPSHPETGGVSAHTVALAHHLAEAGHDVTLVSWAQPLGSWPSRPGTADDEVSGIRPFPRTIRALSMSRPDSWVRAGVRLREMDAIIVVYSAAVVVPTHLAILRAAGALREQPRPRPQSVVVCPQSLPRAPRGVDARLLAWLFSHVDSVLVHSGDDARTAHDLGARRVSVSELPPPAIGPAAAGRGSHPGPTRLLAVGHIREDTGTDVLLRAMRPVPEVRLTIAGEIAHPHRRLIEELAGDPALAGRVTVRDGHVPADELAELLAQHDVLVLPYDTGSTSQDLALAHAHGLPVLASDVGPFSQEVVDGVNGLLVPAGDEGALSRALRRLGDPGVRQRLAEGVQTPDVPAPWARYLGAIEVLSVDQSTYAPHEQPPAAEQPWHAAPGRSAAVFRGVAGTVQRARQAGRSIASARAARQPVLDLRPEDLPDWVRSTDVLGDPAEAGDARRLSHRLGLPRSFDGVSSWAALGALAAILRVRDDGRRSAVIVDETGSRSLLSRWARAVGFAPVEIEFTGTHPSVAALDVDAGSLDVIARIHPRGCDSSDIDNVLEQGSWALRAGGLLIVTVPLGPPSAEGALGPADVRAILARANGLGFVLVGDLDGDVNARMREAGARARADDAAYGLVRLTLRRR